MEITRCFHLPLMSNSLSVLCCCTPPLSISAVSSCPRSPFPDKSHCKSPLYVLFYQTGICWFQRLYSVQDWCLAMLTGKQLKSVNLSHDERGDSSQLVAKAVRLPLIVFGLFPTNCTFKVFITQQSVILSELYNFIHASLSIYQQEKKTTSNKLADMTSSQSRIQIRQDS